MAKQKQSPQSNDIAAWWLAHSSSRYVCWRQDFYEYRGTHYRMVERDYVAHLIHEAARDPVTNVAPTSRMVSEATAYAANECFVVGDVEPPFWLGASIPGQFIACKNCLLDVETRAQYPHTSDFFNIAAVDYDYDPTATCPQWQGFLNWLTVGDAGVVHLLRQWFCYCLLPQMRYQKMLWLLGDGNNGKSVFCSVLREMLGARNCSAVPLERFDGRFGLTPMLGKTLNLVGDVSETDRTSEGVIKQITGNDAMAIDRKFKTALEAVELPIRLVFSSNSLPPFRDKSFGLWRRLLLVDCKQRLADSEVITGYEQRIIPELAGVLNWALDVAAGLIASDRFDVPPSVVAATLAARLDANPAATFLLDSYKTDPSGSVEGDVIYARYCDWSNQYNHHVMAMSTFAKQLKATFPSARRRRDVRRVERGVRGPVVYRKISIYDGIAELRAEPDPAIADVLTTLAPSPRPTPNGVVVSDTPPLRADPAEVAILVNLLSQPAVDANAHATQTT